MLLVDVFGFLMNLWHNAARDLVCSIVYDAGKVVTSQEAFAEPLVDLGQK